MDPRYAQASTADLRADREGPSEYVPLGLQADTVHSSLSRIEELAVAIEGKVIGHALRGISTGNSQEATKQQPSLRSQLTLAGHRLGDLEALLSRVHDAL